MPNFFKWNYFIVLDNNGDILLKVLIPFNYYYFNNILFLLL